MKVSVLGLGYVGSVAAAGLASAGHEVLGIDVDPQRIDAYRSGAVPLYEPGLTDLLKEGLGHGRLRFAVPGEVREPLGQVIVVATGTPTGEDGGADLGQVQSALEWIREREPDQGVVVMKSTVPPGTGVRLSGTILRGTGLAYVSNPEFLREGRAVHDWLHPDRVVIGAATREAAETVSTLYQGTEARFVVTDITSAEMIKYAANAFLATKISFINEIAALCDRVGAMIDDVSQGISLDPRIGPSFLKAGVGYGGSCFPKDVRALDQLALTNGHNFELLKAVITVNNRQRLLPLHALRERFGSLSGLKVGVLGVAFKPSTDDIREAPSVEVIRLLVEAGARVSAYDPQAARAASQALPCGVRIAEDPADCASECQALVLMTEWPEIVRADWSEMARQTSQPRLLFDGRNALDPSEMRRHGFEYIGVGRSASVMSGTATGADF